MPSITNPTFAGLLRTAVEEPGTLSSAYRQFHSYSLGNQLLAMFQCQDRGLPPGPLATFPKWKELGRHVRKGEKALTLCMPVAVKRRQPEADADSADSADSSAPTFVGSSPFRVQRLSALWPVVCGHRLSDGGPGRAIRASLDGPRVGSALTRGRRRAGPPSKSGARAGGLRRTSRSSVRMTETDPYFHWVAATPRTSDACTQIDEEPFIAALLLKSTVQWRGF